MPYVARRIMTAATAMSAQALCLHKIMRFLSISLGTPPHTPTSPHLDYE